MVITETEAQKKLCVFNGSNSLLYDVLCQASDCMAWVRMDEDSQACKGFCGLVYKPNSIIL